MEHLRERYRFGPFEFDAFALELSRGGEVIAARNAGNPYEAMTCAVELGALLLDRGRLEDARALAGDIEAFATAHPPAMLLAARLRACSGDPSAVKLARRAREAAGGLWTDRQAEILASLERGVADG